jgi:hypothetical protein
MPIVTNSLGYSFDCGCLGMSGKLSSTMQNMCRIISPVVMGSLLSGLVTFEDTP